MPQDSNSPSPTSSAPSSRIFSTTPYFLGPPTRISTLEQPSDLIHHILSYDSTSQTTRLVQNNLMAKLRKERCVKIVDGSIVILIDGLVEDFPSASSSPSNSPTSSLRDLRVSLGGHAGGGGERDRSNSPAIKILPSPPSSAVDLPLRSTSLGKRKGKGLQPKTPRSAFGVYFGKGSKYNKAEIVDPDMPRTKEVAILLAATEALRIVYENFVEGEGYGYEEDRTSALSPISPLARTASGNMRSKSSPTTPLDRQAVQSRSLSSASASASPISPLNSHSPISPSNTSPKRLKSVTIVTDSPYLVKCMTDWVFVWQQEGYQNSRGEWVRNHVEIQRLAAYCEEIENFCGSSGGGIGGGEGGLKFWLTEKIGVGEARRLGEGILAEV